MLYAHTYVSLIGTIASRLEWKREKISGKYVNEGAFGKLVQGKAAFTVIAGDAYHADRMPRPPG